MPPAPHKSKLLVMGKESKLVGVMLSLALFEVLEKRTGAAGKQDFIRAAIAEKLARDFGEHLDASALAVRVGQGRRTDLERRRAELARERAEKAFASARARLSALADARRECEAAEAEFESALARGAGVDYKRAAAARKRVERLSAQRNALLKKFLSLRAEALRVALDCAGREASVPATKPRRKRGDKAAGK
ncbi:MAG: hypothetical protein ACI4QA_02505 [Candidatus Spyradosoma sp.]